MAINELKSFTEFQLYRISMTSNKNVAMFFMSDLKMLASSIKAVY